MVLRKRNFKRKLKGKRRYRKKRMNKRKDISNSIFRESKYMRFKKLILPEKYMIKIPWKMTYTVAAARNATQISFLLFSNPFSPAGANSQIGNFGYGGGTLNTMRYDAQTLANASLIPNADNIARQGRGHEILSGIYASMRVYATKCQVRCVSSTANEMTLLAIAPCTTIWSTGNTVGAPAVFTETVGVYGYSTYYAIEGAPYSAIRDSNVSYSGKDRTVQSFLQHHLMAGVSKKSYMNDKIYQLATSTGLPLSAPVGSVDFYMPPAWQIFCINSLNQAFTGAINFEISLDMYCIYEDQVFATQQQIGV